ncbi:MAG: phage repressor protein [Clostridia bacterium]|nr:MAG: phage repressor protein [Clostridia bacterium]
MTVNTELLRRKIEDSGMTITSFSAAIEMDPSTFYRKIDSGGCKFTIGQMHKAVAVLKLKKAEAVQIFLGENSQKCEN